MKKLLALLITAVSMVFLTGCGTVGIYNSQNNLVTTNKQHNEDSVYEAIKMAGTSRGWIITKLDNGLAEGKLNVRNKHFAVIHISYDTNSYSINYVSSENLKSDGSSIHKSYNSWILNLKNSIDYYLENMDMSSVTSTIKTKNKTKAEPEESKKETVEESTWR